MKKIFAALSLSLLALTGCGKKENVLIVGTNAEFPPFEYIGGASGDEIIGLDIDIAKQIAADSGKTLKVENMNFDALIVALNTGKIDMIASGMTITKEREQSVNFSSPYYEATQVVVTRKQDDSIKALEDIKGKKIAVQLGTTGDTIAKEYSDKVTAFNTSFEAFMELKNAKVDMVIYDSAPAENHIAKNPSLKMQRLEFNPEFYGFAVAKDNGELLTQINATLSSMKENGQFDQLFSKYLK